MSDEEDDEGDEEGDEDEEKDEEDLDEELELELMSEELTKVEVSVELTREQASKCLMMVGETMNNQGLAYIKLSAVKLNLTDISIILAFKYVMHVDVSNNRLTDEDIAVLSAMESLHSLFADRNRLKTASALTELPNLQVLSFKKNEIDTTSGIDHRKLTSLELNSNLIKEVSGLDPEVTPVLTNLELRANQLVTTQGISFPSLVKLYLAENQITKLEGLDVLVNLKILHLRGNPLKKLDGFSKTMIALEYINLRENRIKRLKELKKLFVLRMLKVLVITDNPSVQDMEEDYRVEVLSRLPRLRRIDKDLVTRDERIEASAVRREAMNQPEEEEEESVEEEEKGEEEEEEQDDEADEDEDD